ncbi:aspartate--tRNA ligase dps1 [Sorochytrium milnesiophthora]
MASTGADSASSHAAADNESVDQLTASVDEVMLDENGKPLSAKQMKKRQKELEKAARKAETAARIAAENAAKQSEARIFTRPDVAKDKYGNLPVNQSKSRTNQTFVPIADINASLVGKTIRLRARVQKSIPTGAQLCFFTLRQQFETVQAVVASDKENISKQMVKFAASIPSESIIVIEAEVVGPPEPIKSCTVKDAELKVKTLFVESTSDRRLPFTLEDASRPEEEANREDMQYSKVNLDTRLNNRVVDLRTITNQSIFRIQSGVCQLFREFLYKRSFIEMHSPKIIGAASEGGANVFTLNYFKRDAFLAQSPQFYKQMMVCADFERVFEIGPVFRAENSFTHRHMTEFTGLDLEMAFNEHYHEVLDLLGEMMVFIFTGIQERHARDLEIINRQFPFEPFQFLAKPLCLEYPEAVKMIREAGVEMGDEEDLSTEKERLLGKLVKEKYKTDFFILDKFPLAVRPFYTMPDPNNPIASNSYDFFMRGEEIMSGAQRIHDPEMLQKRAEEHGVETSTIQPYLDAFKYGVLPHAGGGIGLERVVMLYLSLNNIRRTSLFPRDPVRLAP